MRSLPSLLALNLITHLLERIFDLLLKCVVPRAHYYIEEKHMTDLRCKANATSSPTHSVLTRFMSRNHNGGIKNQIKRHWAMVNRLLDDADSRLATWN